MIKFIKWACASLVGHLIIVGLPFSVVMAATFLYLNFEEGTLTTTWALHVVFVALVSGIAAAITGWYLVTKPLIMRMRKRSSENPKKRDVRDGTSR